LTTREEQTRCLGIGRMHCIVIQHCLVACIQERQTRLILSPVCRVCVVEVVCIALLSMGNEVPGDNSPSTADSGISGSKEAMMCVPNRFNTEGEVLNDW